MTDKCFLDTNIFVYAHDILNPAKQKVAQELIFNGIRSDNMFLSTQVLSEFFVTAIKKINLPVRSAKREITLLGKFNIIEINHSMILQAIDLHKKYNISYWDSLIMVSAKTGECNIVYSEDLSHGQKINGIKIINPF